MKIGSLFSGTTGMDMALEGELTWVCDNMPAARKLLDYHYPEIKNLGNVKEVQWEKVPEVDIITAGFPCQPVSLAGKGLGEKDERWLFPEVIRAVRILRPRYLLLENVPGLLGRGAGRVLGSLAEIRYDAKWVCVRASDAGAPHKRERWFALAYPASAKCRGGREAGAGLDRDQGIGHEAGAQSHYRHLSSSQSDRGGDASAYPNGKRREIPGQLARQGSFGGQGFPPRGGPAAAHPERQGRERETIRLDEESFSEPAPVDFGPYQTAIRKWELIMDRAAPPPLVPLERKSRNHSVPRKEHLNPEFASWLMGLPEGWITDVPGLTYHDKLRLSGNAVVPQQCALALEILCQ